MLRRKNSSSRNGESPRLLAGRSELYWPIESVEEWRDIVAANPFIWDVPFIEELAGQVRERGLICPFDGAEVPGGALKAKQNPYREGFTHNGLNSRLRAVIYELNRAVSAIPIHEARIYAPEAVTPFAMLLRSRYPKFIGSEYTEDPAIRENLFPLLCEDLLNLSFPDAKFHAVVVNDVFEHVPDIDRCLRELARVTAPGGHLITTFPFNMGAEESVVRARLGASGIEYLSEPEYHGNPMDPQGSLVFEIPGWDILARTRAAGWSNVRMVYHQSLKHGIISNLFSGIFVMVAVR